jgi:predicted nucleic acid-binding protein
MLVVADTGPLISLAHINLLHLLDELYPDFVIAQAVYDELIAYKQLDFRTTNLSDIKKHLKQTETDIPEDLTELGLGEAQSIVLLKELNGDALLIDDMEARRIAEARGIHCFGALALLLQAKEKGLITEIKPLLQELLLHKRHYSYHLLQLVLEYAGEL